MFVTYAGGITEYYIRHEEHFLFPVKWIMDIKEATGVVVKSRRA